jgi:Ni,Fe-hydrogenase I cytochrome b subunit
MSFLDKVENAVYLNYVLKILGIVLFGLGLFEAWHQVGFGTRFLVVAGPIAWYVGDKFNKVYR